MRLGHKSSGGLQEGFEANVEVKIVLEAIEQSQLIDDVDLLVEVVRELGAKLLVPSAS